MAAAAVVLWVDGGVNIATGRGELKNTTVIVTPLDSTLHLTRRDRCCVPLAKSPLLCRYKYKLNKTNVILTN